MAAITAHAAMAGRRNRVLTPRPTANSALFGQFDPRNSPDSGGSVSRSLADGASDQLDLCLDEFGLFFGKAFDTITKVFPLPILGIILLFEGPTLMLMVRDSSLSKSEFSIVLLVGVCAAALSYGYAVGMVIGMAVHYLMKRELIPLGTKEL